MFTNKTNLIVFAVIIAVVALVCTSVVAFISIEDAKKENEAAKLKIEELNGSIDALKSELEKTHSEAKTHKEQLEKYQQIFDAWTKSTPEVNEAVNRITDTYSRVLESAHLFPQSRLEGLEDEVMDAIYGAIRSTNPGVAASNFEKVISKLEKARYDNVIKEMIQKIKENGVTFPEDEEAVAELEDYFDKFTNNAEVINSFKAQGIDSEIKALKDSLDSDEENDLVKAFEDAVAEIKAPITLNTSLEKANVAWNKLYAALESDDTLKESTVKARELLDEYTARKAQLENAKKTADVINSDTFALKIAPDLATKNAIADLEARINAWISEFNIDNANMYLVNDLAPVKKAYENELTKLRALYGAFKKAVESIGKVNVNSKASIDNAFSAFKNIKDFKDTDTLLFLESPYTVSELYAALEKAYNDFNYLVSLINAIRAEIDRIHTADPNVTYEDVNGLDAMTDELLSLGATADVLNTEKTDYVTLLKEARLLPYKNDAFKEIKSAYDAHYAEANDNRDIILALVAIKDAALNDVEKANTTEEINAVVGKAKADFVKCFE